MHNKKQKTSFGNKAGFFIGHTRVNGTTLTKHLLTISNINITYKGYIYVWVSNESNANLDVFFDDLKITHTKGAILQEDHYYPFGLSINALSSTAPLSKPNQFKYNGNEEQTEFDLNLYDFNARYYDATLGRFMNIDPLADWQLGFTPYHFSYNNPISYNDPSGLTPAAIASSYINGDGVIIDHKDDGDDNIYLVVDPDNWDGTKDNLIVVGQEGEGMDYFKGDEVRWGDLSSNGKKLLGILQGMDAHYDSMSPEWEMFYMLFDVSLMSAGSSAFPKLPQSRSRGISMSPRGLGKLTKPQRLARFKEALGRAVKPRNAEEAIQQINKTLDSVEDSFSGVPKNPNAASMRNINDGRMYGILDDAYVTRHSDGSITALTKGHKIVAEKNGGYTIYDRKTGGVFFRKN